MKNTVKNALLVIAAALFIACLGGVFVGMVALAVGNGVVMTVSMMGSLVCLLVVGVVLHTLEVLESKE